MNRHLNILAISAIVAAASLTSCSDDETPDFQATLNLNNSAAVSYNSDNYWDQCYNVALTATGINVDGFQLSHSATDWGGGILSWYGFCPSKSADTADHTADWTWLDNQWSSITGGGLSGKGTPFIVGCWNSSETTDSYPEAPSCMIAYGGYEFQPQEIYVTNSTYAYYTMINGSAFNKVFTESDWFHLIIIGYNAGRETARIRVDLAKGTDLLDTWQKVDLSPLGTVTEIAFQMASSDSGQWGMNTPSYFCIDRLTILTDNR